ncbi:SLATT domain-containing protein [Desulfosporosinus sp. BG]|uniref:SLATT domain-containing protein n=1 Tax=Desulfosporosinus sp. BG TaxID=1633135 RepID=UPI00114CCBE9|nr:SLATT domain-containing protein [Desulfosporosinus sp. BG]
MTDDLIDSLLRKIWITRKCRIVASERLENAELYAQFIFVYYSVILVSLSIWTLFPEHSNSTLSLISVIASIGLLSVSLFITSRNYKNRALALKSCYIKLENLLVLSFLGLTRRYSSIASRTFQEV